MKISTKGRYGLRIMLELAERGEGEYVSVKEISQSQGVSEKYAEQIINQLGKAGFVKSARGSKGGYKIAADPKKCTVGEILRLMEGDLSPVPCIGGDGEFCERSKNCKTQILWERISKAVSDVVDTTTLSDLLNSGNF